MSKILPLALILSLAPIWRRAGVEGGLNAWQYLAISIREPMKHISVEAAIERARQAGYLKRPSNTSIDS